MIQKVVHRVRFAVLWEYFGITLHSPFIAEVASSGELQRSPYDHCHYGLRAFVHSTLAQLPVLPSGSCHMAIVFGADISNYIVQRWDTDAHHQLGGRLKAFSAYDFSEMRASFSHDFRLLVASVAAFLESFSVA